MARVKGAMMTRKRRNKTLKLAKSYWGSKSRHFKMAKQAVYTSGVYAYVGRKLKKREFRQLWIARISAAVAPFGINYSRFMNGLKKAGIEMNRKAISELAIADRAAFEALVEAAKKAPSFQNSNGRSRMAAPVFYGCLYEFDYSSCCEHRGGQRSPESLLLRRRLISLRRRDGRTEA